MDHGLLPSLMFLLKQKTEILHLRLERLPYFIALSNGTLPLASYVNQLRAFATAFGTLEYETSVDKELPIRAVICAGVSRYTHLLQDLCCFADQHFPEIKNVKLQADAMADRIRHLRIEDPVSLMGYVYVLQGTILGNRVHLPDIKRTFNIECENGTAFYTGYGDQTDEYWGVFASQVNSYDIKNGTTERILAAAREAFEFLEHIHSALFPLPSAGDMTFTSTSLNPEAGTHAVPKDERELIAALIAGRHCYAEFPYLCARYGERGKRFTDSDAAWLATLPQLTLPLILSQTAWLGSVLASRGMPRITMERQLLFLHDELVKAIPDKRAVFDLLLEAVSWLKKERLKHISDELFDSLCLEFAAKTENELHGEMKGSSLLIVSAVCDERAGIRAAVTSIEPWLTNADRFNNEWCTAVQETIAAARAAAD